MSHLSNLVCKDLCTISHHHYRQRSIPSGWIETTERDKYYHDVTVRDSVSMDVILAIVAPLSDYQCLTVAPRNVGLGRQVGLPLSPLFTTRVLYLSSTPVLK